MKLEIQKGRIIGIREQALNPILPDSDLAYVEDKDLYKEIRNYIKSDHRNLDNKFIFSEEVMKGSNPFLVTAVDMFFKKHHPEYRIATQGDLEQDPKKFKGVYVDSGLALRSLDGVNSEKAKHLYEQLRSREPKIKFPIFLNLRGLNLDSDLNFSLTNESLYKTAKCLNWENETRFKETDEFGLPSKKDSNPDRQIWTRSDGLVRLYLDWYSNLDSGNGGLADSFDYGRVVLVKSRSDALKK